jgi:heme/copper-type cytochrome/quinol oxidase subunit 2
MQTTRKLLIGVALAAALAAVVTAAALAAPAGTLKPSKLPHVQRLAITITGRASDTRVSPAMGNLAVAAGVPVQITVTNYTRESHTFTIPGLNVSALILPAHGQQARKTTFTFTAYRSGTFAWHCAFCAKDVHGRRHPMGGTVYAIVDAMVLP